MGLFDDEKVKAEKKRIKHAAFVSAHGDRFCKAFTGFDKDLLAYEISINQFLQEFPEYRIVSMTSGTTSLGTTVLCYFEKIKKEDEDSKNTKSPQSQSNRQTHKTFQSASSPLKISQRADQGEKEKQEVHFPTRPPEKIVCPICNSEQKANRTICFHCGSRFIFDDEEMLQN